MAYKLHCIPLGFLIKGKFMSTINSSNTSIASVLGLNPSKVNKSTGLPLGQPVGKNDPVSEFLAYQKLSPQEKMVDAILKKHGLTKEDLANLSPEDLKKIQDEIKAGLQTQMKQQLAEKGILLDISA